MKRWMNDIGDLDSAGVPVAVVYDKDKQVRFLACGLLYYIIDAAFNNKRDGK